MRTQCRRATLLALTLTSALALAACSSSGSSSSSSGSVTAGSGASAASSVGGSSASSNADVTAAEAYLKPFLTRPTDITVSTPLSAKPPTGKKVFVIGPTDQTVDEVLTGYKAATAALGWSVKAFRTDDPSQITGFIKQAIQQKADYISYIGFPSQAFGPGIAAAKAAKVPIFGQDDLVVPQGPANWIFSMPDNQAAYEQKGKISANLAVSETNGKANMLVVNVPAFPVLSVYGKAIKSELAKACQACKYSELDEQYGDVTGGKVPSAVVGYLRSHTGVNYVLFVTGGFSTGFSQAAQAANIKIGQGGVLVSDQAPNDGIRADILSGKVASAVSTPNPYDAWLVVDAMARQSIGDDLEVNWKATVPLFVQTKATTSSPTDEYTGPTGYAEKFKTLWKVG